ncbi:hypothetical protein HK100_007379 [Physocladia obscura]|uniref:HMG box domain-containing protein n=1 Tax=Physocladia obscura TaxID=109957 RepID=A0AAD5T7G5_9FUNG|nr:hypothetical protein HK100_007379 [Physocladia obscura]
MSNNIGISTSQQKQQKGKRILEVEVEEPKDAKVKGANRNSTAATVTATEAQPQKKQKTKKPTSITNSPFVVTLSQSQIDALQSAVNNLAQTFSTVFAAPGPHQISVSSSSSIAAEPIKKKFKDPNAPHRAPSGYNLFAQEKGKSLRLQDNSVDAKDVMRATGAAWKALSDEERAEWNVQALPGQQEYTTKKASYVQLHKDDVQSVVSPVGTKVKRNKRDPNLPKLPVSAYTMFTAEHYQIIKESQPEIANKDRLKEVARKWATLSEKEKKKYEADAEKDKQRYITEMNAAGLVVKISSSNTISSTKKTTAISPVSQQQGKDDNHEEDDDNNDDDDEGSSEGGDENKNEEQEEEEDEEEPQKPVAISKKQKKQELAPATTASPVQTRTKKTASIVVASSSSTPLKKASITHVHAVTLPAVAASTPESKKKNKKLSAAAETPSSTRQGESGEIVAASGRKTKLITKVELVKKKKEKKLSLSGDTNE